MSYPLAIIVCVGFWAACWWGFVLLYDATVKPPGEDEKK